MVLNSSSPGKTAGTLQGMVSVIEQMMPEAFVLENTDLDQDNEHREGLDHILSELAAKGYDTQAYIVNSVDFGLPQIRRRLFIVGVLSPGRKFKTTSFVNFRSRLQGVALRLPHGAPNFYDAMLPDTHPLVVKELKLKTAAGSKAWDSSTIDIHRGQWALQGKGGAMPACCRRRRRWRVLGMRP